MPAEAYAIGINLVADAAKVTGPLDSIIQALRKVQEAQSRAQEGMNTFVSSLSGARRVADSLAAAMDRVARSTQQAAAAAGRMGAGSAASGGGLGAAATVAATTGSRAPRQGEVAPSAGVSSGGSYVSPYSAAASAGSGHTPLLAAPPERLMLGYDPVERTVVRGSTVPMYGSTGPGIPVGGAYGPPSRGRPVNEPLRLTYDPVLGPTGTALAVIPGQGDSMGSGANFRGARRPNGYTPNFTMPEDLSDLEEADRVKAAEDAEYARMAKRARRASVVRGARNALNGAKSTISGLIPDLHHRGPNMVELLGGYAAFEIAKHGFEDYSNVEQIYGVMGSDSALSGDPSRMAAIRSGADAEMRRFRVLAPEDVAKNAAEAYALSGGKMDEQPGIASLLDRLEQNMILRGKSPQDANAQAKAVVKALDISNRLYDPKTGQYSQARAEAETSRMQALLAVGGGFTTGQSILSFEKSSKLAGQRLDLVGEAEMAHFIETDPRNAGTRINSLENLFGGHASRMAKKDKAYWTSQGLYDKSGMVRDNQLLQTRPLEWVQKYLAPLGGTAIDDHTQRMNVSAIAQETIGANGNIMRQAAGVGRSNVDANSAALLASPKGSISLFDASVQRFMVTLGKFESGPGISILNKLTDALDRLTTYMNANPKSVDQFAAAVGGIVKGAIALVTGIAHVWSEIPAPLKDAVLGGAAGAAIGAKIPIIGAPAGVAAGVGLGLAHAATKQSLSMGYIPTPYGGMYVPQDNATVQKQSYEGNGSVHVYIDGDEVSHRVERRMANRASRPSAYGNAPDPMEVAPRPGMPVVAL